MGVRPPLHLGVTNIFSRTITFYIARVPLANSYPRDSVPETDRSFLQAKLLIGYREAIPQMKR